MNLQQAETEIYKKIGTFTGVDKANIRIENQPLPGGQPFVPPTDKAWCKASVQYADSEIASLADNVLVRDRGIINIQCFVPKNTGTLAMTQLCDAWRSLLQSFGVLDLEIYRVHAPQQIDDPNFYAKIIRAEFRVN